MSYSAHDEISLQIAVGRGLAVETVRGHKNAQLRELVPTLEKFLSSSCEEEAKCDAKYPLIAILRCGWDPQQPDGVKSTRRLYYYEGLLDEEMTLEKIQDKIRRDDGPLGGVCKLVLMRVEKLMYKYCAQTTGTLHDAHSCLLSSIAFVLCY